MTPGLFVAVLIVVVAVVFAAVCIVAGERIRRQERVGKHIADASPSHQIGVDISAMTKSPSVNIGTTTQATHGTLHIQSTSGYHQLSGGGTWTTTFPVVRGSRLAQVITGSGGFLAIQDIRDDESVLPERDDDEPIGAFKAASLLWEPGGLVLVPMSWSGKPHTRIAQSYCGRGSAAEGHKLEHCTCGFHALKSRAAAEGYAATGGVLLEVELGGRVLVCAQGYRAEWQRILGVIVPGRCYICSGQSTALVYREQTNELTTRCVHHLDTFRPDIVWPEPKVCDVPITFDMASQRIYGWAHSDIGS